MGRPKGITGSAAVLSDKDFKRVITNLSPFSSASVRMRNMLIVTISFKLGLRSKELASLKIIDVYDGDKIKSTLRLYGKYTKGNKHRDLPLSNQAVKLSLEQYIQQRKVDDGLVFNLEAPLFRSQKGSFFSANAMSRLLKNIFIECGFNDASSHTGRRSLLTKLATSGISAFYIRDIAGHSSVSTTQRYIDINPEVIKSVMKNV